jgi:hypothetical protein
VVVDPAQTRAVGPALTGGSGFTVTVTELVSAQPSGEVPITVYTVVTEGVATGLAMFGFDNPVAGLHV